MTFNTELWNTQTPGAGGYEIERSLRFNSADSAYLSRTPSSAGNRRTFTLACWVKRTNIGGSHSIIFDAKSSSATTPLGFNATTADKLEFYEYDGSLQWELRTTQLFRDPGAWMHLVAAVDTTQATSSDRVKLYINGSQITDFSTEVYPAQNRQLDWNATAIHTLGVKASVANSWFDGYLADVHFLDGIAVSDATSFGEFDDNGVWQPIEYTGIYTSDPFYSSYATNPSSFNGSAHNLFDGDLTTSWQNTDTSGNTYASVDLTQGGATSGVSFTTSFEMYGAFSFNQVLEIDHAGGTYTYTGNPGGSGAWVDFTSNLSSPVTAIRFKDSGGTGTPSWNAIRVDSTILTEYGANSFHLDFADNSSKDALGYDAAGSNDWTVNNIVATSTVYSNYLTTNDTSSFSYCNVDGFFENPPGSGSGHPATKGFDGLLTTSTATCSDGSGRRITFTPPTAISYSSSVEVYTTEQPNSVYINGTDTGVDTAALSWVTVASGSGSITSMWFESESASNPARFAAIRVDGTILVDQGPTHIDSLRDSPTNGDTANDTGAGGEVPGNYATANPLDKTNATLTNGNLDVEVNSAGTNYANGTIAVSSGKWYFEVTAQSGTNNAIGVADITGTPGFETSGSYVYFQSTGDLWFTSASSYGASWQTAGDVIGVALDMDTPSLVFYKNGVSQGTAITSWLSGKTIVPCFTCGGGSGNKVTANFGQRAFAYTAPSGYKALCTANLPTPTIENGSDYFETKLYTGNGSTQTISGLGFSPDLVWLKGRSQADRHYWFDTVRGKNALLASNETTSETDYSSLYPNYLQSFNSDGFTLGYYAAQGGLNKSGETYAAWTWDAGSSTVSNTDGSITSSVRAQPSAGCSCVTYTTNGTSGATVGHGLGASPYMIITKSRTDGTRGWGVYHRSVSVSGDYTLILNSTAAQQGPDDLFTAVSSTTFTLGNDPWTNWSTTQNMVAYCFAPVEGYSAFGSYEAVLNVNGPFVYTGFRPRWIMIKNVDDTASPSSYGWTIIDTSRHPYNGSAGNLNPLYANASYKENSYSDGNHPASQLNLDILSNGFKLRSANYEINYGQTYVYAAFAEHPFKYARAR